MSKKTKKKLTKEQVRKLRDERQKKLDNKEFIKK